MSLLKLFVALLIAGCIQAAEVSVDFDPAQAKINWQLAGNVHTVHGTFALKKGHIKVDAVTGAISGEFLLDAASGESGNPTRDKRMNKEILESQRFPEIKWIPAKVDGPVNMSGASTVRVSGSFLIHGDTHQVSVPLDLNITGASVTGKGKFSVPYVEWGMKDPSNFLFKVEKSVEIEVEAIGHLMPGAQP